LGGGAVRSGGKDGVVRQAADPAAVVGSEAVFGFEDALAGVDHRIHVSAHLNLVFGVEWGPGGIFFV
jgi:hypothetical protein